MRAFSVGSESPLVQLQGPGHHAAVNFGQYVYAGYFPNHPTIARTNVPTEDPDDEVWEMVMKKPEAALLRCFPLQIQATTVMAVIDILSNHSPDEEYIGEMMEDAWAEDKLEGRRLSGLRGG